MRDNNDNGADMLGAPFFLMTMAVERKDLKPDFMCSHVINKTQVVYRR